MESKYRLAEQEKLTIESEISQLRASPINERDSPYDTARSSSILSENQARLEALQSRVKDLEAYILEQVFLLLSVAGNTLLKGICHYIRAKLIC